MGREIFPAGCSASKTQEIQTQRVVAGGRDLYQGQRPVDAFYRAVDKNGKTLDFLLSARRDEAAATGFFARSIENDGWPEKVVIDKGGANLAGLQIIPVGVCNAGRYRGRPHDPQVPVRNDWENRISAIRGARSITVSRERDFFLSFRNLRQNPAAGVRVP